MANWSHFRELWDDCGVSRGRLFSEFPPNWREIVCRKAYDLSSAKAASIAARLKPPPGSGSVKKWMTTNRSYDLGKDWLSNAEKHEPPDAFDVIVASKNPSGKRRVLIAGDFPPDQEPWKVNTQIEVPRTAKNLLACVGRLLAVSDELVLVDQYFDPAEPRFSEPFAAFVAARVRGKSWRRCELHVAHPVTKQGQPDKSVLSNRIFHMQHHLARLIPVGNTLCVRFWYRKTGGKKLHPRFVLTEHGGIHYDHGLDEGDSPSDSTIVSLMDQDLWHIVRGDFGLDASREAAFGSGPDCIVSVVGTG